MGSVSLELEDTVEYQTPELRVLGSFASLTLGTGGSCPDGGGRNNTQNSDPSNSLGTVCSEAHVSINL